MKLELNYPETTLCPIDFVTKDSLIGPENVETDDYAIRTISIVSGEVTVCTRTKTSQWLLFFLTIT